MTHTTITRNNFIIIFQEKHIMRNKSKEKPKSFFRRFIERLANRNKIQPEHQITHDYETRTAVLKDAQNQTRGIYNNYQMFF